MFSQRVDFGALDGPMLVVVRCASCSIQLQLNENCTDLYLKLEHAFYQKKCQCICSRIFVGAGQEVLSSCVSLLEHLLNDKSAKAHLFSALHLNIEV